MNELTPSTMLAVSIEIFGSGVFWTMVGLAVVITAAYIFVVIRDRRVSMRKFLVAQVSMPFGAVAAVALVMLITNSRPANIGGPIDVIVLLAVALAGAVGLAILVYTAQSMLRPPGDERRPKTGPRSAY